MERDFCDSASSEMSLSHFDRQFLKLLNEGIHFSDGHYQMPLPFASGKPVLPNKVAALSRLHHLRKRLERDNVFCQHYVEFMTGLINKRHAERVSEPNSNANSGKVWYIPHHGLYHPQKPNKIRVEFDCSATYQNRILNACLLQGPDLINSLVGVLLRFRKEQVALMCDFESMFYQFKVNKEQRDFLRFLWWDTNDFSTCSVEYRMTVHLFGAKSSPGCANFGLINMAEGFESEFDSSVADFVRKDLYVDDDLKSVASVSDAIHLINGAKMCSKAGLRLHKFTSNAKEVIEHLTLEERASGLKDVDIACDTLPVERALGILWCIESDKFRFRTVLRNKPLSRRGIMSTVCSIYDPLGFIAPVVLVGKRILQQICADHAGWDDPIQAKVRVSWGKWRQDLHLLEALQISRCVKPCGFGEVLHVELHNFSDANVTGYGQCSYLRLVSGNGVHCLLVMAKSRVAPLNTMTVPRFELTGAPWP